MLNRLLSLLFFCCIVNNAAGQSFQLTATLEKVNRSGFYQIPLSGDVTSTAKLDLSDLRLMDANGGFVPYLIKVPKPVVNNITYHEVPIITKREVGKFTELIFERPEEERSVLVGEIELILKNTASPRIASYSGSTNGADWYAIDEGIRLNEGNDQLQGKYSLLLNVPATDYRYFRLKINNEKSDPLNILKVNVFEERGTGQNIGPVVFANPDPTIKQTECGKISEIRLVYPKPTLTDVVILKIEGPRFYKRECKVYIKKAKDDSLFKLNHVAEMDIRSGRTATIEMPENKLLEIVLLIENGDNPPLRIAGASTTQYQKAIVAWLEANKSYNLLAGNDTLMRPEYDLVNFRDSLPEVIPVAKVGRVIKKNPVAATGETANTVKNVNWIWAIIVVSVVVMAFIVFRLVRDARNKVA